MHISRITLVNYRNFSSADVRLTQGVNTIVGENGSGKTNLFRAVRLLLDENLVGRNHALNEIDFHRGLGDWRGHWIAVNIEFSDISKDESMQALFMHRTADDDSPVERATYGFLFRPTREIRDQLAQLADGDMAGLQAIRQTISLDDYETVIMGRGTADLTDLDTYRRIVGDFDSVIFSRDENGHAPDFPELGVSVPRYFSLAKEFSFSYIAALRDVVRDFQINRNNPLRVLLNAKSEEIPPGDFDSIVAQVEVLNSAIESRNDVTEIRDEIRSTFKQTVGETYSPTSLSIKSELPLEATRLFQSLKLYVGEHGETYEGGLNELSLGGANLVFLTLKLLEFQYRSARKAIANFLIIEEPEAHIHTHVQKTLFERVEYRNTQIIYSTHSTHISEVSQIERVNVLAKSGTGWQAYQPSHDLDPQEIKGAQRFLDAIRCNLLFARSVMLVEGDAEEILVPSLIKQVYGVSIDELGLSLINVRSTGFKTLANLFDEKRIQKYCAIVTDLDAVFFDTTADDSDNDVTAARKKRALGSSLTGAQRKRDLDEYAAHNPFVQPYYARHTFEVDFALASEQNRNLLLSTVDEIYVQEASRKKLRTALLSKEPSKFGLASLKMAEKLGKGWFALMFVGFLTPAATVPNYILEALGFSVRSLPTETWARILQYRLDYWMSLDALTSEATDAITSTIVRFQIEEIDLSEANNLIQGVHEDLQLDSIVKAFALWQSSTNH
ncbi:ATP-dependent nuclease [Jonesia quinghaiensis]|uniref:ATP-dependent nuclease n=1 Tax=Jonesia quinghaiensis TaxID=262806 RepID=UPI00040FB3CF|nr:AAA family ATPase [Jonesia quinghaiensis]